MEKRWTLKKRCLFLAVTITAGSCDSLPRTNKGNCEEKPTYGSRSYETGRTPKSANASSIAPKKAAQAIAANKSFFQRGNPGDVCFFGEALRREEERLPLSGCFTVKCPIV